RDRNVTGVQTCALPIFREALRLQPDLTPAQSNLLFCLNYDPHADAGVTFEEHRRWGELQACRCSGIHVQTKPTDGSPWAWRPLQIGRASCRERVAIAEL